MEQFDKTAYWKKRIIERIEGLFFDVSYQVLSIATDMEHIGADPEELRQAIRLVGEGFDALKGTVDHIKDKKK